MYRQANRNFEQGCLAGFAHHLRCSHCCHSLQMHGPKLARLVTGRCLTPLDMPAGKRSHTSS